MITIGFTSIDSYLSAFGLGLSQRLFDLIRENILIAGAIVAIGLLIAVYRSFIEHHLRPIYVSLFLLVILLLILPSAPLQVTTINQFSKSNQNVEQLKEQYLSNIEVPKLLTFMACGVDALMASIIKSFDYFLPQEWHFLDRPFAIEKDVISISFILKQRIISVDLEDRLRIFLINDYLPVLIRMLKQYPDTSIQEWWPSDVRILNIYDDNVQERWRLLKTDLNNYLMQLSITQETSNRLIGILGVNNQAWQDALLKSVIYHALVDLSDNETHVSHNQFLLKIYETIPYFLGFVQMLVYVSFPLVCILLIIYPAWHIFNVYLSIFLWGKVLILPAALSSYLFLLTFLIAGQSSNIPIWIKDIDMMLWISLVFFVVVSIFSFFIFTNIAQIKLEHIKRGEYAAA